jgi:tRNA modification GTPase
MVLDGLPLRLVDTAGLRESGDEVERLGVAKAKQQASQADLLLVIFDAAITPVERIEKCLQRLLQGIEHDAKILLIMNKSDLLTAPSTAPPPPAEASQVQRLHWLSTKTGDGIAELRTAIAQAAGFSDNEASFTARARHIEAITRAIDGLHKAWRDLVKHEATEIIAEELRAAHNALGEIVGEVTPDDLLGRIFSEFCIGK